MDFTTVKSIRNAGFEDFRPVRDLQACGCIDIPKVAGVYLVLYTRQHPARFAATSCGGHFKGKDPTVSMAVLRANWVKGAIVLYIGKAGGGSSNSTLQKRLGQYMRFGAGEPVGHHGGRFIWQLNGHQDLIVCWKPSGTMDAVALEDELIREFSRRYGRLPFANLRY